MPISVFIIQPPLVQLNGPYPSGAYLSAFFRREVPDGVPSPASVRWIDAGNLFFRELFSAPGLSRIFGLCRDSALEKANAAERSGDVETAFQLRRYVSLEKAWTGWVDSIVSILCTGDRELCHSFVRSPFAPRGARMDSFLSSLETEATADDARMLATLAVEDLADFITAVFDPEFSLVRYAESIAAGERSFALIEAALDRPMVVSFLEPLCASLWDGIAGTVPDGNRILFCLSVPFPGCLVNALAMARSIRRFFGSRATISMGGGYVNTELRSCENERLYSYVDILSFDRGYGGYAELLKLLGSDPSSAPAVPRRLFCPPELAGYEKNVTATLVPDYSDIDFSRYPRLADDPNPMHRLWSDGTWLKAYLAHGCYWHRCSFCDVSLDYIAVYLPVGIQNLYKGLRRQAIEKRVHGIHLVDEAAPPRALRDFALENLKAAATETSGPGLLPFWGNIRFEKTFTRDLADFLSAGGLSAVSGGIEIASPEGFKSVGKGIDLENLVAVCAAFKEAGVLVHSYLIYGYWNEDEQEVVDSAEVMRQLFAAGLVDSAFWHKFVLTRHSRVYCEYRAGQHRGAGSKGLRPIDEAGDFAENDLRFEGENSSEKYTAALDTALRSWMSGEDFERPVRSWFPFPVPAPRIAKDQIGQYIASYENKRDIERNRPCDPDALYFWAGSAPIRVSGGLSWWHLGEEVHFPADDALASAVVSALAARAGNEPARAGNETARLGNETARPGNETARPGNETARVGNETARPGNETARPPNAGDYDGILADTDALALLPRKAFKALRHHGLCRISPLS